MFLGKHSETTRPDWRRHLVASGWAAMIVGAAILSLAAIVSQTAGGIAFIPLSPHADVNRRAEVLAHAEIDRRAAVLAHADIRPALVPDMARDAGGPDNRETIRDAGGDARVPFHANVIGASETPAPSPVSDRRSGGDRLDVGDRLAIGDRLEISVFEKYATMDEAEHGETIDTLVERSEISGDQTIQADGTVSPPFVDAVRAALKSAPEVEAALEEQYAAILGGEISVVVRILEREPVYVTGAVPASAALDYRPSMIVMHALAVTGTAQNASADSWRHLDVARERVRVHQARTRVVDLLGRASVLLANADRPDTASDRLAEQIGQQEADRRLAEARRVFELEEEQKSAEIRAAEQSAEMIEEELAIVIESLGDAEFDMREKSERADQFEAHLESGLTTDDRVQIVRNERAEAISHWNTLRTARSRLERNLAEARQTAIRIDLDRRVDQEREIQSLRAAIAQEEQVLGSLAPMLDERLLAVNADREPSEEGLELEIVRRTPAGIERLEADRYTRLHPGDILDVKQRSDGGYQYVAL